MDTPVASGLKRKVVKVMKLKTKGTPNSSIYKKKVKSAINVSLNKSHSWNTLKSNNRALASQNDKLKFDLKMLNDVLRGTLKKNNELTQANYTLHRLTEDSASLIESEISQRLNEFQEKAKVKLKNLADTFVHSCTIELQELCSRSFTSVVPFPARNSCDIPLQDQIPIQIDHQDITHSEDVDSCQLDEEVPKNTGADQMSMIMEQSLDQSAFAPQLRTAMSIPGDLGVTKSRRSGPKKCALPMRVPKSSKDEDKLVTCEKAAKDFSSPLRRETFLINPLSLEGISDISPPADLVPSSPVEIYQEKNAENPESETNHPSPVKSQTKANILKPLESNFKANTLCPVESKSKANSLKPVENKINNWCNRQELFQSDKRKTCKERFALKDKNSDLKLITSENKKNTDIFIINQFGLMNKHENIMKKLESKSTEIEKTPQTAEIEKTSQTTEVEKRKNIPVQHEPFTWDESTTLVDMELTTTITSTDLQIPEKPSKDAQEKELLKPASSTLIPNEEPNMITVSSRSRGRVKPSVSSNVEVPDAITMRSNKPGQLVFAAARKEENGARKNVPINAPRARSKSKKQIAELIDNLPQEEPKSIFDFHDQTPRFNSEKAKQPSVFDLSADKTDLSVLENLDKYRKKSQKSIPCVSDDLNKDHASILNIDQNIDCDGAIHQEPLKDSPQNKTTGRARAQSRGRSRHRAKQDENTDNDDEITKNKSTSRAKSTGRSRHRAVSPNQKMDSDGATYRESLKDSPQNKMDGRSTAQSRGRSMHRATSDNCNEATYQEPLKDSPRNNKTEVRSRAQSRGRSKNRATSADQKLDGDDGIYQEPLKDSPQKKTAGRSRAQSRGRSKHRATSADEKLDGDDGIYQEPLKDSPQKKSETRSRAKSRGRSQPRVTSDDNKVDCDDAIYQEPLKHSPDNKTQVRSRAQSRGRSRHRAFSDEASDQVSSSSVDKNKKILGRPDSNNFEDNQTEDQTKDDFCRNDRFNSEKGVIRENEVSIDNKYEKNKDKNIDYTSGKHDAKNRDSPYSSVMLENGTSEEKIDNDKKNSEEYLLQKSKTREKSVDQLYSDNDDKEQDDKTTNYVYAKNEQKNRARSRGRSRGRDHRNRKQDEDTDNDDEITKNKSTSRAKSTGRSRSRGRIKSSDDGEVEIGEPLGRVPIIVTDKDQEVPNPNKSNRYMLLGEGTVVSEPLKGYSPTPKKTSDEENKTKITDMVAVRSRSRSRRRSLRNEDDLENQLDTGNKNCVDENENDNNTKTVEKNRSRAKSRGSRERGKRIPKHDENNDDSEKIDKHKATSRAERSRSRSRIRSGYDANDEMENDKFATSDQSEPVPIVITNKEQEASNCNKNNRYMLLGEGTVISEPLKVCSPTPQKNKPDEKNKNKITDRVSVRSRSRSRKRSLNSRADLESLFSGDNIYPQSEVQKKNTKVKNIEDSKTSSPKKDQPTVEITPNNQFDSPSLRIKKVQSKNSQSDVRNESTDKNKQSCTSDFYTGVVTEHENVETSSEKHAKQYEKTCVEIEKISSDKEDEICNKNEVNPENVDFVNCINSRSKPLSNDVGSSLDCISPSRAKRKRKACEYPIAKKEKQNKTNNVELDQLSNVPNLNSFPEKSFEQNMLDKRKYGSLNNENRSIEDQSEINSPSQSMTKIKSKVLSCDSENLMQDQFKTPKIVNKTKSGTTKSRKKTNKKIVSEEDDNSCDEFKSDKTSKSRKKVNRKVAASEESDNNLSEESKSDKNTRSRKKSNKKVVSEENDINLSENPELDNIPKSKKKTSRKALDDEYKKVVSEEYDDNLSENSKSDNITNSRKKTKRKVLDGEYKNFKEVDSKNKEFDIDQLISNEDCNSVAQDSDSNVESKKVSERKKPVNSSKKKKAISKNENQENFDDDHTDSSQSKGSFLEDDVDTQMKKMFDQLKSQKTPKFSKSNGFDDEAMDSPLPSKRVSSPNPSFTPPPQEAKRRRAATKVNYAEPSLNCKLRRGDPHTSVAVKGIKVDIFKSPKSKAKKKAEIRKDVLGPLHNLAG